MLLIYEVDVHSDIQALFPSSSSIENSASTSQIWSNPQQLNVTLVQS